MLRFVINTIAFMLVGVAVGTLDVGPENWQAWVIVFAMAIVLLPDKKNAFPSRDKIKDLIEDEIFIDYDGNIKNTYDVVDKVISAISTEKQGGFKG